MKSFTQDVSSHVARVPDQVLYASPRKVELFLTFLEKAHRLTGEFGLRRSAVVDFNQADASAVVLSCQQRSVKARW